MERSGRDPWGIGGGTPFGEVLLAGVLFGLTGRFGVFKPPNPDCRILSRVVAFVGGGNLRAGRLGRSSCSGSFVSSGPYVGASSPDGRRTGRGGGAGDFSDRIEERVGKAGRDGLTGGEGEAPLPRNEDSFEVNPLVRPLSLESDLDSEREGGCTSIGSSLIRLGGNTGSSVSPQAGALMRPLPVVPVVLVELTDVVDAPRPRLFTVVAVVE